MRRAPYGLLLVVFLIMLGCANNRVVYFDRAYDEAPTRYRYTPTDSLPLYLTVYRPARGRGPFPAVIFLHGGDWRSGSPEQWLPQARYLAARGMVAAVADYRLMTQPGTTPLSAVRDAKSAIRYLRTRAGELRVDPSRLALVGSGAGGQLAAAATTITYYNNSYDDRRVATRPQVLVLLSPAVDFSPGQPGHSLVGEVWPTFSPLHNTRVSYPPTLLLVANEDKQLPLTTVKAYRDSIVANGGSVELLRYPGHDQHFFAPDPTNQHRYLRETLTAIDQFLIDQGLLAGQPYVTAVNWRDWLRNSPKLAGPDSQY